MAAGKWIISGRLLAENFQNAIEAFGSDKQLIGLLLGNTRQTSKYITGVVFVEETEQDGLNEKVDEVVSYLSADLELLGFAKFPSSSIDLTKLSLDEQEEPKLCLKLPSPEELKQRNFKKLFDLNPQVTPKEDASQLMSPNAGQSDTALIVHLSFDFNFNVHQAKEQFCKYADNLSDVDFTDSESTMHIGNTTAVTLEKENKSRSIINLSVAQPTEADADTGAEKHIPFSVHLAVQASKSMNDAELRKLLIQQVKRIFCQAKTLLSSEKNDSVESVHCSVYSPSLSFFPLVHLVTFNGQEANALRQREVCQLLNLTVTLPAFRPEQSLLADRMEMPGLLTNPHQSVKYPNRPQRIAIVSGKYQYHHYMQDNFDDSGWGCAYRSFQTVWSWFRLQHLTTLPIPTHRQLQQCLVDLKDKPAKFVGSTQWIGSMELSFCLETMMGVSSRILSSKSGAELSEHARAIIFHFENYGAPIMIGGGQLAQTILGIDYNVRSGETRFLVLDPHYTGSEDIDAVVKKGWCGWKPASFWDKKAFYNLLLPITLKMDAL
uniref:Ufm1-specific protease n=1 Tax=Ditylenchus dipsaci TaxID=166011 RepID=A0A915ENR0_9BILA